MTVVSLTTALCLGAVVVCAMGNTRTFAQPGRADAGKNGVISQRTEPPDYSPLFDALRKIRKSNALTYRSTLDVSLKPEGETAPMTFSEDVVFRARRQGTGTDGRKTPDFLHVDVEVATGRIRRFISYASPAGSQLRLYAPEEGKYTQREGLSGDIFALGVLGSLYFNTDLLKGLDDASGKNRGVNAKGQSKLEAALAAIPAGKIKLSFGGEPALPTVPFVYTMELGSAPNETMSLRFSVDQKTKQITQVEVHTKSAAGELRVTEKINPATWELNARLLDVELMIPERYLSPNFKKDDNLTVSPLPPDSPGG